MTANVRLVVAQKEGVLKVPNAALRFRLPGDETVVVRGGPGAAAGGGGTPPSPEQVRERLVKALGLSPDQQQKLDPILQDTSQKMRALGTRGLSEGERRVEAQRIREASRTSIRAILTPEQRSKYDTELSEAQMARQGAVSGRVFILDAGGKPTPVTFQLGITDGNFTEILGGDLKEGQEVIVGTAGAAGATPGRTGSSPGLRL
jgi:HlyD family secretion protein